LQVFDEKETTEELERMRERALKDFDKNNDEKLDMQVRHFTPSISINPKSNGPFCQTW
jgi:hypothetical protein